MDFNLYSFAVQKFSNTNLSEMQKENDKSKTFLLKGLENE